MKVNMLLEDCLPQNGIHFGHMGYSDTKIFASAWFMIKTNRISNPWAPSLLVLSKQCGKDLIFSAKKENATKFGQLNIHLPTRYQSHRLNHCPSYCQMMHPQFLILFSSFLLKMFSFFLSLEISILKPHLGLFKNDSVFVSCFLKDTFGKGKETSKK